MSAAQQRLASKKLSAMCRMRGLELRPDATAPLCDLVNSGGDWQNTLQELLAQLEKGGKGSRYVDAAAISTALSTINSRGGGGAPALEVLDLFEMRAVEYHPERQEFISRPERASLCANAEARYTMLALRLALVEQRVRRHELFKSVALSHSVANQGMHLQLTSINALLGRKGMHVVLGVLTEVEGGRFILEDAYSYIELEGVREAERHAGFFASSTIVLVEGEITETGTLFVKVLGLPPPELRSVSMASIGTCDPFGQYETGKTGITGSKTAQVSQTALEQSMLIVLSDLWLDRPSTLKQLEELLSGYEMVGNETVGSARKAQPAATFFTFVLCGNFSSPAKARGTMTRSETAAQFETLAQLLAKFPTLAYNANFVLVPGPDDPSLGAADVLPRAPVPKLFTNAIAKVVRNLHSTSSPARLKFCGQEVVILREELLAQMRRCTVLEPNYEVYPELANHLVETLLCQAHVYPLPVTEAAVYWRVDPALWLHPAPDVLVVAERSSQFLIPFNGTLAFNPGSFAGESNWMVYRPLERKAEPSSLNEE
uniref:DNA polymerase epsilon subunit n=1 Tax=Chrysotila carterae TaxID=13221 RepID=A0A7S4FBD8_CHRCT